jgi:stress-induced morphogen
MASKSPRQKDEVLKQVETVLEKYKADHPNAQTKAYRQNSVSVRVRIVDPEFAGTSKFHRHDAVWPYFEQLPEEIANEISMLLLLTPGERPKSLANREFDDPLPSPVW